MAEMMNIGATDKVNATKCKNMMFWQYTILKKKIGFLRQLFLKVLIGRDPPISIQMYYFGNIIWHIYPNVFMMKTNLTHLWPLIKI